MSWELALDPIVVGLMGSVRILTMLAAGPLFSHQAIPMRIRVVFAAMVAWVMLSAQTQGLDWQSWGALEMGGRLAAEALIGLVLGFGSRLIFTAFEIFGEFVSTEGALAASRNIDPGSGVRSVVLARGFRSIAILVFLVIGGHHEFLRAAALSFEVLPLGGGPPEVESFAAVGVMASTAFQIAMRLAAPVTVSIFIQNVAVGVMGRTMPQLNLMTVQLPAHIGLLLIIVGVGAGDLVHAMKDAIEAWPSLTMAVLMGAG